MDKLLVTVLGIGLTAFTLMWSVDYISNSYQAAEVKAKAQAWVTEAAQITTAARQAGTLSQSGDDWKQGSSSGMVAAPLVTAYLSDLPKHSGNYVFWPCYLSAANTVTCPRYTTDATHASDATILEATVENAAVCQQILMLANRGTTTLPTITVSGSNPITVTTTNVSTTANVNPNQQFTCANASGTYYFLYRVFMDR